MKHFVKMLLKLLLVNKPGDEYIIILEPLTQNKVQLAVLGNLKTFYILADLR